MKGKCPSRTAQMVAMGRALADSGLSHVAGFSDPTARVFASERGKQALAKIERRDSQWQAKYSAPGGTHERRHHGAWEGVVMYLTHDAMRATLRDIAGRSASGSTLIVNYHTVRRGLLARMIFWLLGEPQISAWTPEEMAADLRAVGFVVREDSGMVDWNTRFAQGKARAECVAYMHIAVARRRS